MSIPQTVLPLLLYIEFHSFVPLLFVSGCTNCSFCPLVCLSVPCDLISMKANLCLNDAIILGSSSSSADVRQKLSSGSYLNDIQSRMDCHASSC